MMKQNEIVWRHLLVQVIEHRRRRTTMLEIAHQLSLPLVTVHRSLERPRSMGVVEVTPRGVTLLDPHRLLLFWAAHRNLARDILLEASVDLPVSAIESALLPAFIPTAFTAYAARFGNNVASYARVHAYGDPAALPADLPILEGGEPTLIVLEPDPLLASYGRYAPLPQIYADLFNINGWQAPRFLDALDQQLSLVNAA
jgi:hypothetical protein